jgi:hypothetical protein
MTGFARFAIRRSDNRRVEIRVAEMSLRDAAFWDRFIQPTIAATPDPRADRWWSWTAFRTLLPLAQHHKNRRCRALTILLRAQNGQAVPAAMMLFIEKYPYILQGADSEFVWFIATAPSDVLTRLGVPMVPSLGRACIDSALVASDASDCSGRIWLHCAPTGGYRLYKFYRETCKLLNLGGLMTIPTGQPNDGRYFHATQQLAAVLIAEGNGLR